MSNRAKVRVMDDLVERLRAWEPLVSSGYEVPAAGQAMFQAADRIEALQARIAELEAIMYGEEWDIVHNTPKGTPDE